MENLKSQTLIEHLTELRVCIQRSLWALVLGFFACVKFSEYLFDVIRMPIAPYLQSGGLVFTSPVDKFMAHIKVSVMASAILTCPFWIYQLWLFIAPGLYKKEKRYAIYFILAGTFLFLSGVLFVYYLVFPMAFKYLLTFGGTTDLPMITINEYLGFFVSTVLLFGLSFEMPLVIVILGVLGIFDAKFLREKRRYAIMIMAVLSAIVTPPDAISMMALLVPLCLLYEIAIFIVAALQKKPA